MFPYKSLLKFKLFDIESNQYKFIRLSRSYDIRSCYEHNLYSKRIDQSYNNRVTSESRKVFSYFNISRLPIALAFDFTYGIF